MMQSRPFEDMAFQVARDHELLWKTQVNIEGETAKLYYDTVSPRYMDEEQFSRIMKQFLDSLLPLLYTDSIEYYENVEKKEDDE